MRNTTREQYNRYLARIQELNGISDATKKFSVAPSVQQTLETKIQESSAFLGRINIHGVEEMEGEKIGLGVSGPIASRSTSIGTWRSTARSCLTGCLSSCPTKYRKRRNPAPSGSSYGTEDG